MNLQEPVDHIPPDHSLPPAEGDPPGRKRKYWIWIFVALICGVFLYWLLRGQGAGKTGQPSATAGNGRHAFTGPVTLTTATAAEGDIGVYLEAIGTVTALYTDSITAQVTGVITAVHYKEGQVVRKGDPLIDIDPRPYEAVVIQAQGALERDQKLLAEAQMDLQRYKDAWARNAIPGKPWKIRKRSFFRIRERSRMMKAPCATIRCNSATATSPLRLMAALDCAWSTLAIWSPLTRTTSLVVITQIQPITVVATISEDSLSEVLAQPHHGLNLPLEAWDRANDKKLATEK